MFADPRLMGVAFTGSTETAALINRALAVRDGPISRSHRRKKPVGLNAMIVDSTALAGAGWRRMSWFFRLRQRGSALFVLACAVPPGGLSRTACLIKSWGAMDQLNLGDPVRGLRPISDR